MELAEGKTRLLFSGIVFIGIVALCIWIGRFVEDRERDHLFRGRALRDIGLVHQELRSIQSGVFALEGLYRSSEHVTDTEFRAFSRPILKRQSGLVALFHTNPSDPSIIPLVAWGPPNGVTRPERTELNAAFSELANERFQGPHVLFAPHPLTTAPDQLIFLLPLSHEQGVIGGIVSIERALEETVQTLSDTWAAIEVHHPDEQDVILAEYGVAANTQDSLRESYIVDYGDARLELVARPTERFIAATTMRLAEGLVLLATLLFLLFFFATHASRERRQAAEKLRALQSALPIPWALFDENQRLMQWNESFARLLELDDPDDWGRGIDPEDFARLEASFAQAIETGSLLQFEVWRINSKAERRSLLAIARSGGLDHSSKGLQVVWMDSTETRELEEKLWRSQKLDAVGQLAGGIAHDFNNALTAITGYSSMVLASLERDTPVFEDVEHILSASRRAAGLTGRLLTLTRSHQGHRNPIDINAVLEQTLKLARSSMGKGVSIELDLAEDLPLAYADELQVEHLFLNLLFNARDALPDGGVIVVTTEHKLIDEPGDDSIVPPNVGPHVVLSVGDNGQGIPAENLLRIFEPLYTTKPSGRGTGLGLSMVQSVVNEHEGGLWCFSEVGVGTTIRVALPTSDVGAEFAADHVAKRGNERILVVDDQLSICELTKRLLGDLGYDVTTTGNPRLAIDVAKQRTFDLFLLDVLLPDTSGTELAQELQAIQPQAAILFMSGYSARLLEDRTRSGQVLDVLSKPFTRTALAQRIREALEREPSYSKPD